MHSRMRVVDLSHPAIGVASHVLDSAVDNRWIKSNRGSQLPEVVRMAANGRELVRMV